MKKNSLIVSLVIILIVFLIGGCRMFGNKEEEVEYKHEQDRVVNYMLDHYELTKGESIKKIEVTEFQKIEMAGFWSITAKVNDKYKISFTEDRLGEEITTSNYSSNEFKTRENKENKQSLSDVELIYHD
ncbi:hypothetical protein [Streptococcus pluranimalium]|uniref:hypothetical protein n=1 Tax=Streptococcus pluranimalium TaxID=82348 RepID=UPI0039FBF298